MKRVKQVKSFLKVAYEGGAMMTVETTHPMVELKRIMVAGRKSGQAELDTVNDDENIADDVCILHMEKVLFYLIAEPNETKIIKPHISVHH